MVQDHKSFKDLGEIHLEEEVNVEAERLFPLHGRIRENIFQHTGFELPPSRYGDDAIEERIVQPLVQPRVSSL